jgi:hypothetical protein
LGTAAEKLRSAFLSDTQEEVSMPQSRTPETLAAMASLTNATAMRDLPAAAGSGFVTAKVVHAATLAALSDRFSVVIQDTGALRRVTSSSP